MSLSRGLSLRGGQNVGLLVQDHINPRLLRILESLFAHADPNACRIVALMGVSGRSKETEVAL